MVSIVSIHWARMMSEAMNNDKNNVKSPWRTRPILAHIVSDFFVPIAGKNEFSFSKSLLLLLFALKFVLKCVKFGMKQAALSVVHEDCIEFVEFLKFC